MQKRFINWPYLLRAIFFTGLLSGSLDGLSAIVQAAIKGNKDPAKIFKYIASAVVGAQAYTLGNGMFVLGLFFHYLIAFSFTILYFILYPSLKKLIANKWLLAILYGVFIWLIMNLLVVPNTKIGVRPFTWSSVIISMLIIIFMVGFPITLLTKKYYDNLAKGLNNKADSFNK